jgi:hypothetical protein
MSLRAFAAFYQTDRFTEKMEIRFKSMLWRSGRKSGFTKSSFTHLSLPIGESLTRPRLVSKRVSVRRRNRQEIDGESPTMKGLTNHIGPESCVAARGVSAKR